MVGWLLHPTKLIVDATGDTEIIERFGCHNLIDPQASLRLGIEPFRTIIEPAEAIGNIRVLFAEGVL